MSDLRDWLLATRFKNALVRCQMSKWFARFKQPMRCVSNRKAFIDVTLYMPNCNMCCTYDRLKICLYIKIITQSIM